MVLVGQSCQGRPQGHAGFEISLKRRERVSGRYKSTKGEMSVVNNCAASLPGIQGSIGRREEMAE